MINIEQKQSGDLKTRDRILIAALDLFNNGGVKAGAIHKIAAALKISPGNLTYHFAKKTEIIYAIVTSLDAELTEVLAQPRDASAEAMGKYFVVLFGLMWKYRFFFDELTLLHSDPRVAEAHARLTAGIQDRARRRIDEAVANGDIAPIVAPNDPAILADNMWSVWIARLGHNRQHGDRVDAQHAIYDCCLHHLSLIQPYASRRFIDRLHRVIKDRLGYSA